MENWQEENNRILNGLYEEMTGNLQGTAYAYSPFLVCYMTSCKPGVFDLCDVLEADDSDFLMAAYYSILGAFPEGRVLEDWTKRREEKKWTSWEYRSNVMKSLLELPDAKLHQIEVRNNIYSPELVAGIKPRTSLKQRLLFGGYALGRKMPDSIKIPLKKAALKLLMHSVYAAVGIGLAGVLAAGTFSGGICHALAAEEEEHFGTGYIVDPENEIEGVWLHKEEVSLFAEGEEPLAGNLPAVYDPRKEKNAPLPMVRHQGQTGTCWAHAVLSAMETNLLRKGLVSRDVNLSELHLAYFSHFYKEGWTDPLRGIDDSFSYETKNPSFLMSGGNASMASRVLASWEGAVFENDRNGFAFTKENCDRLLSSGATSIQAYKDAGVHLKTCRSLPMADAEGVKENILEFGSAMAIYYSIQTAQDDPVYGSGAYAAYNKTTHAYYYSGSTKAADNPYFSYNHGILIIGWDDTYPASNFTVNPGRDGAWIAQNSWGTDWGEDGYFYISYCDQGLYKTATSFDVVLADTDYDHNYQYDGGTSLRTVRMATSAQANVFRIHGGAQAEQVKAVSFETVDASMTYHISVYKDLKDLNDPTSGTLVSEQMGTTDYPGIYRVDLDTCPELEQGTVFSVVVDLDAYDGTDEVLYVYDSRVSGEFNYGGRKWTSSGNVKEGQTYFLFRGKWRDITETNLNTVGSARIKAFTEDCMLSNPEENFELNENDPVQAFVMRMYQKVLGRSYDAKGIAYWTRQLVAHTNDGAGLAAGFILSDEFVKQKVDDDTYLTVLYRAFFDREADKNGLAYWKKELAGGKSRQSILAGFVNSNEFAGLCSSYGIATGIMFEDGTSANPGIFRFVERMYTKALGRAGERTGLTYWTTQMAFGEADATKVAHAFFDSDEFVKKNLSDGDYIEVLYQTFMDRPSDAGGKSYWLGLLSSGTSRETALGGFISSNEFQRILKDFGLNE